MYLPKESEQMNSCLDINFHSSGSIVQGGILPATLINVACPPIFQKDSPPECLTRSYHYVSAEDELAIHGES